MMDCCVYLFIGDGCILVMEILMGLVVLGLEVCDSFGGVIENN